MAKKPGNLCDLPEHALENIFKYLTFDEIAKNRIVSKKFLCLDFYHSSDFYFETDLQEIQSIGIEYAKPWILHSSQHTFKTFEKD